MDKKLRIIVDSNALAYKAFYVVPQTLQFRSHDTSVIFGFLNQIRKLAEDFKTNQFIFCWDSPKSYRKMIYPEYKANRHSNLNEVQKANLSIARKQFIELEDEILPAMGFKQIYSQNGYEADDLIAYLTHRLPWNYLIISGDEDLHQLLYETEYVRCRMYNGKRVITLDDWRKGTGLKDPVQWVKVKAMSGCTSDNVKGLEGIGEIKAINYLLGTMPEGKNKEKIESEASKEIIQRNMDLVCLPYCQGVRPIEIIDGYKDDDVLLSANFMEIFREYGMGSFMSPEGFVKWREAFDLQPGSPEKEYQR